MSAAVSTTLAIVVGCGILCAFACFVVAELIGSDVDWRHPDDAGCDLAWGGKDSNVIRFRRGRDDEPELQRHR